MSFAIVVGGAGALGSAIISEAKKHEFVSEENLKFQNWKVAQIVQQ